MSSTVTQVRFRCSRCSHLYEAPVFSFIDAEADPSLAHRVMDGSLFVRECPECGCRELITVPVVYKDADCLICLSDRPITIDGLEGSHGRLVADVGSLMEKVKLFHAGLDDAAVELVKYVTRGELGKDVNLKFVRTEGADNEMIFTYPSEGKMEMIAVGFNVYEDCCGILTRNPAMTSGMGGLAKVDREWVEQFLR